VGLDPVMRRILLALFAFLVVWAALVAATGGIQWRIAGVVFRSRDYERVLLIAIVFLLAQAVLFRRQFERDVDRLAAAARGAAPWLGGLVALVAAIHAVHYGGFTAGGSDSYGYVSEAYGWATGHLPRPYDLPLSLPFPSGDEMQMPLGYRAGQAPHTMVPTYAPGLPLIMAAGILTAGAIGPYLVVPVCAALFVWFTFCLGRRAGGPLTGLIAAIIAATSPIVLFQSLWPMTDVPAGALWTGAIVAALGHSRRRSVLAGVAAALGLLVRPNLPLLALVPLAWIFFGARGRERLVRATLFSLPLVPAVAGLAALNVVWYGSPLASGYGRASDIYALESVWPNVQRYSAWLWQSQSPGILLAALSAVVLVRSWAGRSAVAMAWVLFAATLASYIAYFPFDAWWYLRFLLPGLGAVYVLMAVGLTVLARLVPRPWGHLAAAALLLLIVRYTIGFAHDKLVFGPLQKSEHRYADIAYFIGRALPENAVALTMQHSGNVRLFGGRMTLRYDFIDPPWAGRVVPELERQGLHPYLVIDNWEVSDVQKHFGLPADRPLPWPYVARMRESGGVTIYDLGTGPPGTSPVVALEPDSSPAYSGAREMVLKPLKTK
jgi:hypothetical protein